MKMTFEQFTLIALLLVVFFGLGIYTYNTVFKSTSNQTITFNVVGVAKDVNATTITQIHYECIKFCQSQEDTSYQQLELCYRQCEKLGKDLAC